MPTHPTDQDPKTESRNAYLPNFSMRSSPGQQYAEQLTRLQFQEVHKKVLRRANALYGVVTLALLYVGSVVISIVFGYGQADLLTSSLSDANAVLQLAAVGYFLLASDPNTTAQVLKLLMIITGIQFFIGFFAYGSLALTLVSAGVQYYAYMQVSALKTDVF
jgi:hypothetical protein